MLGSIGDALYSRHNTKDSAMTMQAQTRRSLCTFPGWALVAMLMTTLWIATGGGCGKVDAINNSIKDAVAQIDKAIDLIKHDSSKWQQALADLSTNLPKDVQSTIRVEVTQLAERSVAKAGIEFRCNVDFFGRRAVQALERLKQKLLGTKEPAPLPPSFCQVSPTTVDLKLPAERRGTLELSGYDMDLTDAAGRLVQFVMENAGGAQAPIPERFIGRTTHYLITLNSGDAELARELRRFNAAKIKVSWGGTTKGLSEILVRQWTPNRRTETLTMGDLTFTPPKVGRGDADFDVDHNDPMDVTVKGEAKLEGNTIKVRVYMHAKEPRDDWTEAMGWSGFTTAYTAPSGWKILSASPLSTSSKSGRITQHGVHTWKLPQGELVTRFDVYGDFDGDEAGTRTRVIATFNSVRVELEELPPP
jgi:hypothetical protein